MDFYIELKKLGLNKTETGAYLYLLKHGESSPPMIAKGTSIGLTNLYHVLKSLVAMKLIKRRASGKRYVYAPSDPESILELMDDRREALSKMLPDLRALYKEQENKPVIEFFKGKKEVKKLYLKTLEAREQVMAIGSLEKFAEVFPTFVFEYQKKLKKRGIIMRAVMPASAKDKTGREVDKILGALSESQYLPEKYKDVPTDILIWNDNIALISFDEPVFGTLITNQYLVDTFQIMLEVIWGALE